MLILYTKDNCAYCDKVKRAFAERRIVYEEHSITNPEYLKEARGYGAHTMPFLVDTAAHVSFAESDDIIDYASEHSF